MICSVLSGKCSVFMIISTQILKILYQYSSILLANALFYWVLVERLPYNAERDCIICSILYGKCSVLLSFNCEHFHYARTKIAIIDTPTAKAMGFLFLRPLHCHKDFSFTQSPQAQIILFGVAHAYSFAIFRLLPRLYLRCLYLHWCHDYVWYGILDIPNYEQPDSLPKDFCDHNSCKSDYLDTQQVL